MKTVAIRNAETKRVNQSLASNNLLQPTSVSTIPYQENALAVFAQNVTGTGYLGVEIVLKGINRRWYFQQTNDNPGTVRVFLFKLEPGKGIGGLTLANLFLTSAGTFGFPRNLKVRLTTEDGGIIQKTLYDHTIEMPVPAIAGQTLHKSLTCHVPMHNMKFRFTGDGTVIGTNFDLVWVVVAHNATSASGATVMLQQAQQEVYYKDM